MPGLPTDLRWRTVEALLTHRAGVSDDGAWPDYRADVAARAEPWEVDRVPRRAEVREPGEFRYSNIGYLLVRLALERARGGTYFDVIDDVVLRPLGVAAQPFATRADWRRCTHPAISADLRAYDPAWVYTGTFCADPMEAARALAMMMLRGELGSELAARLRSSSPVDIPATHPMAPPAGYGLGVMTTGTPVAMIGHGGQGPGFTIFAAASVDGGTWCAEFMPEEKNEAPLIERCLMYLRAGSDSA